jgi:hypothetical protein
MSPDEFDPFNDRLSRDIRNTLSEAFVNVLTEKIKNLDPVSPKLENPALREG